MKRIRMFIYFFVSLCFVVLWTYAGISKWNDYDNFRFELGRSPYIQNWAGLVAVILPAGELLMSILLVLGMVIGRIRLLGLYLSFFTMSLFTGYIYMMLHFSYYVSCSCGGILDKLSWEDHLLFNVIATVACAAGILASSPAIPKEGIAPNDLVTPNFRYS